jgi:hypothetical protein
MSTRDEVQTEAPHRQRKYKFTVADVELNVFCGVTKNK